MFSSIETLQKIIWHTLFVNQQSFPYRKHFGSGPEDLVKNNFPCSSQLVQMYSNFWYVKFVCNLSTKHNCIIISNESISHQPILFRYSFESLMKEFLSYKNQSIDLLFKLNDWLLSDKDLHHERFKDTYCNKIGILIFWKIHLLS